MAVKGDDDDKPTSVQSRVSDRLPVMMHGRLKSKGLIVCIKWCPISSDSFLFSAQNVMYQLSVVSGIVGWISNELILFFESEFHE